MCRRLPIVLLIVVLVALIGVIDVSCGCCGHPRTVVEADGGKEREYFRLGHMGQRFLQVGEDILPASVNNFFGRCTTKQLVKWSLVGVIALLTSGLVIQKAINNPARYDIVKEAKHVNASWDGLPLSTQEKLENITTALCERLSGSSSSPPLSRCTLEAITKSSSFAEISTTVVPTKEVITTVLTTSEPTPIPIPEELCTEVAANIFPLIKNVVGESKEGFIRYDLLSTQHRNGIQAQLEKIEGQFCKDGFFKYEVINNHQGFWFKIENEFIQLAMDNEKCTTATVKVLSLLYDLGITRSQNCGDGCPLNFYMDDMETNLRESINIGSENSCGSGFFEIIGDSNKEIKYSNSNTYITEALLDVYYAKRCQQRADAMISILTADGHYDGNKISPKVYVNNADEKSSLMSVYDDTHGGDCGDGALKMVAHINSFLVTYKNTNPYVIKALERLPAIKVCKKAGKDVVNYLKELEIYSTLEDASIIISDEDDIVGFMTVLSAAAGYNCKKGFFTYVEEEGLFKVKYNHSNEYI